MSAETDQAQIAQHTPGPWAYRGNGDDAFTVYSEDRGGIALVHDPLAQEMGRMDEIEANARLMAAAPELLIAAKKVTAKADWRDAHADDDQYEGGYTAAWKEAAALFATAIAKAQVGKS